MKRALLIPLIVFALVSMACGLFSTRSGDTPGANQQPAETKVVVQAVSTTAPEPPTEAAPIAVPTEEPTVVEAAPTEAAPTEAAPTKAEADVATDTPAGPTVYKETFERKNDNWSDPLIVTTQAQGRDPFYKITVDNGQIRFAIDDKETYIYKFFKLPVDGTQSVEVNFQNKGAYNTGIGVTCMANKEMTSWYEMRVSASDNFYKIFLYDKKLRTEEGKNPYVLVGKGHLKIDEYYPTKPNKITVTCSSSDMSVDFNGKKKISQPLDTELSGNLVGIAVLSADVIPATIDFEEVVISQEK